MPSSSPVTMPPSPSPAALGRGTGDQPPSPFSEAGAIKQHWGKRGRGHGEGEVRSIVSTMVVGAVWGGSQGQTHSCKERLQYKSIRGAPFLCIWMMT